MYEARRSDAPLVSLFFGEGRLLYILYVDESGQHGGEHFVLAGAAAFERQTYWIAQELDKLQREYLPGSEEPIEFHASAIRAGSQPPWDGLPRAKRYELLDKAYGLIADSHLTVVRHRDRTGMAV